MAGPTNETLAADVPGTLTLAVAAPTIDTVLDAGNSIDPVELVLDELLGLLDESELGDEEDELAELTLLVLDDDIELAELLLDIVTGTLPRKYHQTLISSTP